MGMEKIPEIIALGSSQTMELRASHLGTSPGYFFNHSVASGNLFDVIAILGCYKRRGSLPKKIIIGVSPNLMFLKFKSGIWGSDRWKVLVSEYYYLQALIEKRSSFWPELFLQAEAVIQEYKLLFSIKYALTNFNSLPGNDRLFTVAEDGTHLLRPDGSFHLRKEQDDTETFKKVQTEIDKLKKSKSAPEIINEELFINLIDYLLSCDSQVILFFPPYHPMLYKELLTNKKLVYYRKIEALLMDIAISRHLPVYGSYDPSILCLECKDFRDAHHLCEFSVKKIFNKFTNLPRQTTP